MIDTIFSPSFGNRPSYLVGREAVVTRLVDGLQSPPGARERSVVLLGHRGSGKTVLLWELADRAKQLGYVVASPTITSHGMLERIVEKIQDAGAQYVKDASARIAGGSIGALGFTVGLEFSHEIEQGKSFAYKLTQLARALTSRDKKILILIDELQANSSEIRQIVSVYQELIGERLDVALVMAGLPGAVSATLNDRVLTFLNRATKISLPPLAMTDIDAYYERSFSILGIHVPDDMRAIASQHSNGSPYLMQLIGHHIAIRTDEGGELTQDAFEHALKASDYDFKRGVCQTTLASLSDQDVTFLKAMAFDSEKSSMSSISERMDVTSDYAQKYRKRLIDAGIIEAAGRGYVRFCIPLIQEYLKEEMGEDYSTS